MDKLKDSEIIARLIYKAFLAPDLKPGGEDAMITFPMALDLHARIRMLEESRAQDLDKLLPDMTMQQPDEPESSPDPAPPEEPPKITGQNQEEKREIYARLMQFCAEHGLGARRRIAEASEGGLTLSDVQDLTDCKPKFIRTWRQAAAAMDRIENREKEDSL